jgi:hypothetical protein
LSSVNLLFKTFKAEEISVNSLLTEDTLFDINLIALLGGML